MAKCINLQQPTKKLIQALTSKHQPQKIDKHTQAIRETNCLSLLDHFVEFVLKGLKENLKKRRKSLIHLPCFNPS